MDTLWMKERESERQEKEKDRERERDARKTSYLRNENFCYFDPLCCYIEILDIPLCVHMCIDSI